MDEICFQNIGTPGTRSRRHSKGDQHHIFSWNMTKHQQNERRMSPIEILFVTIYFKSTNLARQYLWQEEISSVSQEILVQEQPTSPQTPPPFNRTISTKGERLVCCDIENF